MSAKAAAATIIFVLFSFVVSANEHPKRLSAFVVNPAAGDTGGFGLMYSHGWTPRWAAEISAAHQRNTAYLQLQYRFPTPNPKIVFFERSLRSYPMSARIVYRADYGSRLIPILGAGVHHVSTPQFTGPLRVIPRIPGAPMSEDDVESRTSAEVMAGFEWRLTDRLGLRASVERLLRNDDVVYDRATKGTLALSWRLP